MFSSLLGLLIVWIMSFIQHIGYVGIVVLMLIDSCNIPIPSEVVMPFSGFLAAQGVFSFWGVVFAGTIGSWLGSVISYAIADWLVAHRKQYRILSNLFSDETLTRASRWFQRYGDASVFFSRMLPVIRTFISLPAGIGKMDKKKFSLMTIAGSFIWVVGLTYAGWMLGDRWQVLEPYIKKFDVVIGVAIVAGIAWWVWKHLRRRKIFNDQ